MATETVLLKQIAQDILEIKDRMFDLETTFNEINSDLHEIKPEYLQKLNRIEAEGTISQEAFEKQCGIKV